MKGEGGGEGGRWGRDRQRNRQVNAQALSKLPFSDLCFGFSPNYTLGMVSVMHLCHRGPPALGVFLGRPEPY